MLSLLTWLTHICCSERWWQKHMLWWCLLKRNMIICRTSIGRWLHSPCYLDIWVFSFLFWFIFYHLCTYHYCASLTIFFSPLDVDSLLLITRVYNLAMCVSHNNFLAGCCIRWGFSFLPHIIASAPSSLANLKETTTFLS
jgi:hypothetical protein